MEWMGDTPKTVLINTRAPAVPTPKSSLLSDCCVDVDFSGLQFRARYLKHNILKEKPRGKLDNCQLAFDRVFRSPLFE